jgi:hypothetical protein
MLERLSVAIGLIPFVTKATDGWMKRVSAVAGTVLWVSLQLVMT